MACFGSDELGDLIKHSFAIEDDTSFSTKVLGRSTRRCKPGGLPLSFAAQTDSSDSDHSPPFEIQRPDVVPTSTLCQQNIAKKAKDVQNLIQARRSQKPKLNQEQIDHYFIKHEVPANFPKSLNSVLSRQIEERRTNSSTEQFSEFAKFEAFENEPNTKLIHIVFPFASHSSDSPPKSLPVRAKNTASMDEFIGLCCFLYTRSKFTPKCSEPWRYSLFMVDDSYDFDTELPPIDRNRTVAECGFTMLAMVENKDEEMTRPNKYTVTVLTMNGHRFVFELDTLNETLEWLRDEALKRRQEVETQQRVNMRQTVYELQPIDNEQSLKLSSTISSSGILEFLLIRKNSSRANFNPLSFNDTSNESGPRAPLFVQTRQRPTDIRQLAPLSSSSLSSPKPNVDSPTTSNSQLGYGNLIQDYMVERVHRLKPKCPSKLAIRDDCLEITPVQMEKRRAFVPQTTQKYITIAWDLIGGVDSERHGGRRLTRIWWLPLNTNVFELQEKHQKYLNRMRKRMNDNFYSDAPQPLSESSRFSSSHSTNTETDTTSSSPSKTTTHSARPSINEGTFNGSSNNNWINDYDPRPLLKAYENLNWKLITIDAGDDDSWQISMKIIEIIDGKNSIIRQIFQNSLGGSRRPKAAAEETFNLKGLAANHSPSESKRQSVAISSSTSTGNSKNKRKSINPGQLLTRMLSKQE